MNRKFLVSFSLVLLLSLCLVNPALAEKSYYAERFDVQVDVQENGSALITETVEFRFSGDPFTFVFRDVSADKTDGLTFLDASMDGKRMPLGVGPGEVEVEAGNPLKVKWHFSPISDSAHIFVVRYQADGVIRKGDADSLIWSAVPTDHDYLINQSTITLTFPTGTAPLNAPTLSRDFESTSQDGRIVLTTSGLVSEEPLVITANFPLNSLTQATSQWQTQAEQKAAATSKALPFGIFTSLATLVLGGLGLFTYARNNRRELMLSPVVSTPTPPADVPPAVIGKLVGMYTFMGTIFDLAQRGILEVIEEKGIWGTKTFMLTRKDSTAPLNLHEQSLLEAVFKNGETQVNMSEVPTRMTYKKNLFEERLEQELIQRGWLDVELKQKRTQLIGLGVIAMFVVLVVFIGTLLLGFGVATSVNTAVLTAIFAGVCMGLFILSLALFIYASAFSILTPSGEEQAVRWKGFAEYLKQASKGKEPAISPDYFERYLAYAAVFGLGTPWAKYFQDLGGVPLPFWFHTMAGSHSDFGAMVAVMSASDASSVGGAGAAAGASGGGSSGAG